MIKSTFSNTKCLGSYTHTTAIQGLHSDFKTFAFFTEGLEAFHKAQSAEAELKASKKEPSFYDIVSKAAADYMSGIR